MTIINQTTVRRFVKELNPKASIETTYWGALERRVRRDITRDVLMLRGRRRLTQYEVYGVPYTDVVDMPFLSPTPVPENSS